MTRKSNKAARLVIRAHNVADRAARTAVTAFMADYLAGSDLPVKGLTWSVTTRSDGDSLLSGAIDSGTPDADVRASINGFIASWGTGAADVSTRPGSDEGYEYIEATGLEVEGSPAEVWGVLGYSAGESGE